MLMRAEEPHVVNFPRYSYQTNVKGIRSEN